MDTLKFVNLAKPPEPLFTPRAAAAQLGLSVKTLMAHVAAGNLRFINIGTASRKIHRFTMKNLTTFIEKMKVRETPKCQSTSAPTSKHSATTFKSGAVGFLEILEQQTKKTPKPQSIN
jgi:hypothetical protein